nr:MAG TPA: hypothetical protein [Caudoviricetes sp.]
MFRVGVAIKKGDRKYHIFNELFAEWDYANKDVPLKKRKSVYMRLLRKLECN